MLTSYEAERKLEALSSNKRGDGLSKEWERGMKETDSIIMKT